MASVSIRLLTDVDFCCFICPQALISSPSINYNIRMDQEVLRKRGKCLVRSLQQVSCPVVGSQSAITRLSVNRPTFRRTEPHRFPRAQQIKQTQFEIEYVTDHVIAVETPGPVVRTMFIEHSFYGYPCVTYFSCMRKRPTMFANQTD